MTTLERIRCFIDDYEKRTGNKPEAVLVKVETLAELATDLLFDGIRVEVSEGGI